MKPAVDTQKLIDLQKNIIVLTDGLNIIQTNKAFLDFFGFNSLNEFQQKHNCISDLFETDPNNIFLTKKTNNILWTNLLLENKKKEYKVQISDKNRQKFIFQISYTVLNKDEDKIILAVSFNDITQNELLNNTLESNIIAKTDQLEQKNKELKQINLLLNQSSEIINNYIDVSKTDLKGNITYASQMFCDTMEYTKEELLGQSHNIVRSPYSSKETYVKLWDNIQNNRIFTGTIQNKTKSGNIIWFEALIQPEYDLNGKKIGYVAYRKNITNEKNLQKLVDEQIEQIRQKDSQLHEQAKITAMSKMIENIAHQWRQPLSIISTVATGLILKLEHNIFDKDEALNNLNKLDESAQFLSHTIDDFSGFFKRDKVKKNFNLVNLCQKCLSMIQSSLDNDKIKIITDIQDDNIIINGYENELSQAVINILNNSKDILETKPNNERFIFTSIQRISNNAVITISDSGEGIDQEIIKHIFEPYFTTKHQSQGTGIGLYMTKEIITKHFLGEIIVQNKETIYNNKNYKGASFIITIPIIDSSIE